MPDFDDRDAAILAENVALFDAREGPRVGDFVRFPDKDRRIAHIWQWDNVPQSIQITDGGSFYLGDGGLSFSGSLRPGVKPETLTLTEETRQGSVWFFHHGQWSAGFGVSAQVNFRVFTYNEE